MTLSNAINGAVARHKSIAQSFIQGSNVSLSISVVSSGTTPSSGASMFSDLDDEDGTSEVGPFNCIWTDADSARANDNSREARIANRFIEAEVVAKFWLEDILLDTTEPYGETYFDRADEVVSGGKKYKVLGYDRFGLGTTDPYILAVALKGSFSYE